MAAIHFDSQSVKKQAKLLEEAADQIQNQTVKVITAANEAVAASWSGKAAEIFVKFMQEKKEAFLISIIRNPLIPGCILNSGRTSFLREIRL